MSVIIVRRVSHCEAERHRAAARPGRWRRAGLCALFCALPHLVSAAAEAPGMPASTTTVDVISVTSLTVTTREQREECRPRLTTERQYLFEQANAQAWPLRHLKGVSGAPMGAATGAYLAAHLLAARIWMLPAALVGGAAGWLVGPFGVALGIGGGILGHALTHKLPVTIGGSVAGAGLGMALWQLLFPPPKSPVPSSVTEIPLEHFLTTQQCGNASHAQVQPGLLYRVDYYYDGALFFADLPYDPGDRLQVDRDGKPVVAPATH